ncbi:uncharacterized protein LOC108102243 isoform X2 [Drosophila ficusphila]|nr:uncharacterized protein LOC108102243 isoform X2 [Drosophila ficusphila]
MFILTQQDVRRVEDIRMLSYSRIGPNGLFCPVDLAPQAAVTFFQPQPITTNICSLNDLNNQATPFPFQQEHPTKELPITEKTVASMATQLGWSKIKAAESEHTFPLRCSLCTSTCDLMKSTGCQHCPKCVKCNSSCQTQYSFSKLHIKDQETPQNAACQTQNISSQETPTVKKKPQDMACQTQPNTNSTGCNTSNSHLVEVASTETYTSNECDCSSEEETNHPCRHCKSQQTCTEQDLMMQNRPQVMTPESPLDQSCTRRRIHIDVCPDRNCECFETKTCTQQMNELLNQERRTIPLSKYSYQRTLNRAPVYKPKIEQPFDVEEPIERNDNCQELELENRKKKTRVTWKQQ